MAGMQAVYYRDAKGRQPVDAFIEKLGDRKAAAIDNQIDRLNDLGPGDPPLPFPWSSQVEGELRELRCHYGSELYRILYRRSRNLFVLLHMLRKDTGKLPTADIEVAKKRWMTSRRAWTQIGGCRHVPQAKMHRDRTSGHDLPFLVRS